MGIRRKLRSHRLGNEDVLGRRREKVLPPHHMGDAVIHVVNSGCQVVRGRAVAAQHHEVVDVGVIEHHLTSHRVFEPRLAGPRHCEPDG